MRAKTNNVFSGLDAIKDFLNPDNSPLIPLVELPESLNPFRKEGVRIFAKLMQMTPLMNVKSLPALNMLLEAETKGKLEGVTSLIENSSGNTAFSLATIARLFGIEQTKAIVSHEVAKGKLQLLRLLGTEVRVNEEPICPDPKDKTSGIYKARHIGNRKGWFNPDQYENEGNLRAHEKWSGPQIWKQTEGKITVFCAGLGTAGTLVGAGGYLKKKSPRLVTVGVVRAPNNPVPGVRTSNLLQDIAFDWNNATNFMEEIGTKESFEKSMQLCRAGLMVGPSSGFALAGLWKFFSSEQYMRVRSRLQNADGEIISVFICPDSPLPYLNEYFEYLEDSYFPKIENENLLINKSDGQKRKSEMISGGQRQSSFEIEPGQAYEMIYPVPTQEAWQLLTNNKGVPVRTGIEIVDIRSRGEYLHFHLPGSTRLESYKIMKNLPKLTQKWKKRKIILFCPMGIRTRHIASILRKGGVEAYSVRGGLTEWSTKDLPRLRPGTCKL